MSNLGAYQDFTTAAKQVGGVEPYLRQIRRAAALEGGGAVLAVVGVTLCVVGAVRRRRAERALVDLPLPLPDDVEEASDGDV